MTKSAEEAKNMVNNSIGNGSDLSNAIGKPLLKNGWGHQYEGTSYKVSTIAQFGMETTMYRLYNERKGVHFYSASLDEVKNVITNSVGARTPSTSTLPSANWRCTPNGWGYQFEGVGWYV